MTKFWERTRNTSGEPDVPSPRYQSWSIKTAVAKHLWKSDPRLFELGIQRPRDPKSMTVFSNLPEVMEQNLVRTRSIPQSPATEIAAVAAVTSSLQTKAMLNMLCFSHKSSVRALCTHRQRDLTSPDPCTWLLFISNNRLSVLVFRASQRDVPHAAAQGPTLTMVSISQHPFQTVSMALLTHLSWKSELKNSVLYNCSIHISYLHTSRCQHTYFPVASRSVTCVLISMSCWNFTPPKNGSPHHLIILISKTLLPPQCLTKVCPGIFSVRGHPKSFLQGKLKYKFAVRHPPFTTLLNLWLTHCVLYFPFLHRRMKYFRLLYNYRGVRVRMQKCYHGAAETLRIHSFTSSVETYLGVHTHSLFAQVLRETWGWHQENQTSLLITVNGSCICWSLWASSCLWIAPINIYGGYAYWRKRENRPPLRREQTPAILFLSHCVL